MGALIAGPHNRVRQQQLRSSLARLQGLFGNSRQLRKELQRIIQHGPILRSFSGRITREFAMRPRILISLRRA
jgi:hypothetical protein